MTDLESRLESALKADAAPPRDAMFRVEVLVRRERAAFRRQLLARVAMALGAAILAALGLAALDRLTGSGRLLTAALAAASIVLLSVLAAPYGRTLPGLRSWRARALPGLRIPPLWY
jgi:hypothetical protein